MSYSSSSIYHVNELWKNYHNCPMREKTLISCSDFLISDLSGITPVSTVGIWHLLNECWVVVSLFTVWLPHVGWRVAPCDEAGKGSRLTQHQTDFLVQIKLSSSIFGMRREGTVVFSFCRVSPLIFARIFSEHILL